MFNDKNNIYARYMYGSMLDGYKIVIIDPNRKYDAAMFWSEKNKIYSYNYTIGKDERPDLTEQKTIQHFENMLNDGLLIERV